MTGRKRLPAAPVAGIDSSDSLIDSDSSENIDFDAFIGFGAAPEPPLAAPEAPPVPASRVVRASIHQGDSRFEGNAGRQCAAMALSAIAESALIQPSTWDTSILNNILNEGNEIYTSVRTGGFIAPDGYLELRNFGNINRPNLTIFGRQCTLRYQPNPVIYGVLSYLVPDLQSGAYDLLSAIERFFNELNEKSGILITQSKAYAVLRRGCHFYWVDSHGCAANGAPTFQDARACFVECFNLESLYDTIRRTVQDGNYQFTLDAVDVIFTEIELIPSEHVDSDVSIESAAAPEAPPASVSRGRKTKEKHGTQVGRPSSRSRSRGRGSSRDSSRASSVSSVGPQPLLKREHSDSDDSMKSGQLPPKRRRGVAQRGRQRARAVTRDRQRERAVEPTRGRS